MNFGQAVYSSLIQKYSTFSGRASRAEWWYFLLFSFLVGIFAAMVTTYFTFGSVDWEYVATLNEEQAQDYIMTTDFTAALRYVSTGLALALFLPGFAVTVRRLQDLDFSYYWALPYFAASVINIYVNLVGYSDIDRAVWVDGLGNLIVIIYCLFFLQKGFYDDNRFGPNPLNPDGAQQEDIGAILHDIRDNTENKDKD